MKRKRENWRKAGFYPDDFKHKVINEYLLGSESKKQLQLKHGIGGKSSIGSWMKVLGYIDPCRKMSILGALKPDKLVKNTAAGNTPISSEEELRLLRKQLEDERLRAEMYLRMIDIAERQYGVPIRKKPGTK